MFSVKTIPHLAARDGNVRERSMFCVFNPRFREIGGAGGTRNHISSAGLTFRPAYLPLVYRPMCRAFHPAGFEQNNNK